MHATRAIARRVSVLHRHMFPCFCDACMCNCMRVRAAIALLGVSLMMDAVFLLLTPPLQHSELTRLLRNAELILDQVICCYCCYYIFPQHRETFIHLEIYPASDRREHVCRRAWRDPSVPGRWAQHPGSTDGLTPPPFTKSLMSAPPLHTARADQQR